MSGAAGHDSPHGSSPVIGSADAYQADQDKQLAESMRNEQTASSSAGVASGSRARGNTFLNASSPTRHQMVEGVVNSSRFDHLADDLQIQDAQQHESAASPSGQSSTQQQQQQQQQTPVRQGASLLDRHYSQEKSRFYRQHRNMSESSIASEGGAFIDHRRQPHYIQSAPRSSSNRTGLRRQTTSGGGAGSSSEEEDEYRGVDKSPLRRPEDPAASGISNQTLRVSSADVPEHAISSDAGSPTSPASQRLHHRHSSYHDDDADVHPSEFSRRPSLTRPEEDVCFPAHAHNGPEPNLLDEMYTEQVAHHRAAGGAPLLHGYQFPFDFGALEEYADREREGLPIPGATSRKSRGDQQQSPPGYGTSVAGNGGQHVNFSTSGSDGASGLRARIRQRKLSESVAPAGGRFKKLALFEGEEPSSSGAGSARPAYTTILDTKTPLLGDRSHSYGATSGGPSSGQARPYRFSFYSNALPSTIHARSLAELPAEGQTFEDLFLGRQSADQEDSATVAHDEQPQMSFSPPARSNGAQTPSLGHHPQQQPPSSKRSSINGMPRAMPATGDPGRTLRKEFTRSDADLEANTWWLDVMCPTDQEMKVLSKVFGIHPLTTEDIQMEETREKIELFRNYYFVCFRSFEQDPYSPTYLEPLNMYIIVFREGTLSFHFRGTPHPQNVRRRIKQLKDYINVTSDWISYALIDDITDAFGPLIQNIEYEVDSIDELVLILKEAEQSDMLRRIGTCRKKVMGLLRLMGNKADVVKGLSKRCNENWSVAPKSDIGLYLSDIQDHITTSTQNLTHYEKILSRSHSNYLAQISIEMTDANNQINDVLSKLTALGTVLIPMNLVTGLWGMNVHVPGQDANGLNWFFGIVGCLAAIAVIGLYFTYKIFVRP